MKMLKLLLIMVGLVLGSSPLQAAKVLVENETDDFINFQDPEIEKRSITESELRSIKRAIDMYHMIMGELPKSLEDLVQPPSDQRLASRWEKLLETDRIPKDGWGREYIYQLTPGVEHEYDLYSEGPDKKGPMSFWGLGE